MGAFTAMGATVLVLATLGCSPPGPTPGPSSIPPPPTSTPATAGCTIPLTEDPYDGFHIGVPAGWNLFTLNGTVVVSRDATGAEETVVHPALMVSGLTPSGLFGTLLDGLTAQIATYGGTMTHVVTSSGSQPPTATLHIVGGQLSLSGQAHLAILPEATAHGSSQGAMIASWAPDAQFAGESAMLAGIGACYGPEPGRLFQVVKDQVFTYSIPLGWSVSAEGQDSITIADGTDASATFLLTLPPASSGVNSPQTLLTWALDGYGVHIDHVLSSVQLPNQQTSNGLTQGQIYEEFTGTLTDGRAAHGLVYVLSEAGRGITSGVMRLALATPALWNSVNSALIHVAGGIQHDFRQDLLQWENLSRQWQAFDQQVQGFDYALNGVDLVNDPTTGATFEAPYSSYRATGPDGPGYYSSAGTKLTVQTPP